MTASRTSHKLLSLPPGIHCIAPVSYSIFYEGPAAKVTSGETRDRSADLQNLIHRARFIDHDIR